MRLFIAINIPAKSRMLLERKVNMLKSEMNNNIKWVAIRNWHLTLKFLGEVEEKEINNISTTIFSITDKWQQFSLQFEGLAAFPNINYPKILVLNVEKGKELITELHNELEENLLKYGFKPADKEFRPHLTLARCKKNSNLRRLSESIKQFTINNFIDINMNVKKVSLMKSSLYPDGSIYQEIYSVFLKE